ncbi:MAG: helix-turn-helix domain-containing protein [Ruminococcus flavefaciens]|nr:helix-turn-helix domain-containing protein [Ruminococcus flavefaciens]MCM1060234.1 helix-turn-helix domain-containing protein [Eubacterium sp.]
MQADVLKMLPYHNGSKKPTRSKTSSSWKTHQKVNENFYIVYRIQYDKIIYTPLYIHSFKFLTCRHLVKSQRFLFENPNPEKLATVSDKLKWHRVNNGLLQRDVANAINVNRTTYERYEKNILEAYPLNKLKKVAKLFGIDVTVLLDDYNLFLYYDQGEQIKKLRKLLKLTQPEFAKYIGVPLGALKKWEQNKTFMPKNIFKKCKYIFQQYF